MTCPRCIARGKTWNGGDPECAFPNGGKFTAENWNCATANSLRVLCGEGDYGSPEANAEAIAVRRDDQSWAAINVIGAELERDHYKTLWLSWYKSRGNTEAMLLLNEHGAEVPDFADCDAILRYHEGRISDEENLSPAA